MQPAPQLRRRVLVLEVVVILAAILYYELGNFLLRADPLVAYQHALNLFHLEQHTGLFVEPWFQSTLGNVPVLLWLLIFFYIGPHFGLTLGFLAWAYWARFPSYPHVRNAFLVFTFLAFGFQWLFPLSPPRLVPEAGLADSIDQTLPVSGQTPWIMRFTNPYAALPSVHFGWALLVAMLAIRLHAGRGGHRWWWLAYPGAIALSILATGNHWILDLALSVVFLAATEVLLSLGERTWHTISSAPRRVVQAAATAQPEALDGEGSDA